MEGRGRTRAGALDPLVPAGRCLAGVSIRTADAVGWIGLATTVVVLGVAVVGVVRIGGVEDIGHLVTSGLRSGLRRPICGAFVLWIAGWVVRSGAPASLGIALLCSAAIPYWCRLDDVAPEARCGDACRAWRCRAR